MSDSDLHGPLMLDLTPLVRKPPDRHYIAGARVQTRQTVAAVIGMALIAPVAGLLFRLGAANLGLLLLAAGAGGALLALAWRPDGLPFSVWASSRLRQVRQQTVRLDDGTAVVLHVGLAPLVEVHAGGTFRLEHPAVEVAPDRLDVRGAFVPRP